jgi:hypothetical protein
MEPSPLKGSKTALLGLPKSGKTVSTRTLGEIEGLRKIFLFTENSADRIADLPNVHWAIVKPTVTNILELWDAGRDLNTKTMKQLADGEGENREKYRQLLDLIALLNNFKCARTGEELGSADTWGPDTVLILDGLSNLSYMAMRLVVGSKPNPSIPQWGMAMGFVEALIMWLTNGLNCHFILISHVEPELNKVTNLYQNMMSTLGKALAPKLPKLFSDVILARRSKANFDWTNIDDDTSCGPGLLPPTESMVPSFVPLFAAWQKQGGLYSPAITKEAKDIRDLVAPKPLNPQS